MRFLFVATVRSHIGQFHMPLIRALKAAGHTVHAAYRDNSADKKGLDLSAIDQVFEVPFERSPYKPGNLLAYKKLKAVIEAGDYDIIHCHTPMGSVIARLAAGSARNKGTKVLYTAHGFHFYDGAPLVNWLVYYPIERILARRTDVLFTMNQEDYLRAQTFRAKRVELVNGVGMDITRFAEAAPEEKQIIRRELGLAEGDTFAISVAQLIPRKNHTALIRAAEKLRDPRFHLFIAGDGVQEAELKALAEELGVGSRIHFLGFRRDVYRLCSAADLFLFASFQEGLPVAVMEAMACGLPIVASAIRGNTDLIDEGKGGFLVEPGDADGFAEAIRRILSDREQLERMKRYNLDKVRAYSIGAVTEQMAELYRSVM